MRRALTVMLFLRSARSLLKGPAVSVARPRAAPAARQTSALFHAGHDHADFDPAKATLPTNAEEELVKIRHSTSHIMALAVKRVFKDDVQVTIGPWIENGFYYDFYREEQISDKDLKRIKKEMDKIIKADLPIIREVVPREEAKARLLAEGETFKVEVLDGITDDTISFYRIGDEWWDLCAGPHVPSTGAIKPKAVALQSVAGAYWRGDEQREMLQRIYGTAWQENWQLAEHKRRLEEAKKRDHRVLGKKLDLFSIQEAAGGGLCFWHPRGARIRMLMEDTWKAAHERGGYELLVTPHIANVDLWKTSGHFDFYAEGMFDQMDVEKEQYQLKPMNCPFHCLVYKDQLRSYRDLPFRWAELGTVYRYERSGTLQGLMRVRGFTQDDAHIFCTPEQLEDEIVAVLELTEEILSKFGFDDYELMLSTRPDKAVGSDEIWTEATAALKGALDRKGWDHGVDEGGGAFYGPKIDLKIKDALGRQWQCSTVQCDFNLPERFELEYRAASGQAERPIMVHRAIFGSLERFFAILLESCGGDLPLWLAPTQMRLLPVTDDARDFSKAVAAKAAQRGIRCEIDSGKDRLNKQIRNAETQRVPIMCVVGEKEMASGDLAVRARTMGDLGTIDVDALFDELADLDELKDLDTAKFTPPPPKPDAAPEAAEAAVAAK